MGNVLSNFCAERGVPESNKTIKEGFQSKSITFPSHAIIERGLSVDNSSQNNQRLSSGKISATNLNTTNNSESFFKESGGRTSGKSFTSSCSRLSSVGGQNIAETDESGISIYFTKPYDTPTISVESVSVKSVNIVTTPLEKERVRSNAIEIMAVDSPGGMFCEEKQFYVQNPESVWEIVNIEGWNPWNGTWQVKGADTVSFPAAPIALKSKEEYEFLSRERTVKPRSFGSFSDTASIRSVEVHE